MRKEGNWVAVISGLRLDLGRKGFHYVDNADGEVLAEGKTLKLLLTDLKAFIGERNAEIVEVSDPKIVLDTADMTLTLNIESPNGELTKEEQETINKFM
jgi:hypothetical protein